MGSGHIWKDLNSLPATAVSNPTEEEFYSLQNNVCRSNKAERLLVVEISGFVNDINNEK